MFERLKELFTSKVPQGYYGAIEGTSEEDYLLGGGFNIPTANRKYSGVQYAQYDVAKNSCTIHAAMGAYSDLTGYIFPTEERKQLWNMALDLGATNEIGWYINKAVDLIRGYKKDVISFQVSIPSPELFEALDKGYSVVVGYRGNAAYNTDRLDGILDGYSFGTSTYGHAVRITKHGEEYELLIDNYPDSGHNTYKINKSNLGKLVSNRVFFSYGYVFIKKESEEQKNLAKINGLKVKKKIEISKARRAINDVEVALAELEGREAVKYDIEPKI